MKSSRLLTLILGVFAAICVLAAPLALYVFAFGGPLSQQHTQWSEFGEYVGGIYAPIAALLTLLIISVQIASQVAFNKHQIDHAFLSNAREDLHFYLDQIRLATAKNEQISNAPLGHAIVNMFGSKSHDQLKGGVHVKDVRRVGMTDDRICALWAAIYTLFQGLRAVPETDYTLVYSSSKQKCIAVLGYALCDALDNFHYVASDFPEDFHYEFHAGPPADL